MSVEARRRREYFARLCMTPGVFSAFRLHAEAGMWKERPEPQQRSWRNVSEHCLVEVARVNVLASRIGLEEQVTSDLRIAAALHDLMKDNEIHLLKAEGSSYATYAKASEASNAVMRQAGFSENIIRLANSVGHESLEETQRILTKTELDPYDKAYLLLHYIDDITRGSEWIDPVETNGDIRRNELDRRIDKNEVNAQPGGYYAGLNEEGRKYFFGETTFEAQRRIGMLVEERIAVMIYETTNQKIPPKELPEFIDAGVREGIDAIQINLPSSI